MNVPFEQQRLNEWLYNSVNNIRVQLIPPTLVSNFRVTPQPGGNLIDFTRSDGDNYTLYINTTPSIDLATLVRLGSSNQYTHSVGVGGLTFYYAVRANKGNLVGDVSGWVSGITLGLAVPATTPDPIPATEFPFEDQSTDSTAVTTPLGPRFEQL
jgi:hypothetical protein